MGLSNLHGTATRHGSSIEVNLFGFLGNSCQTASITQATAGSGGTARVDVTTGVKPCQHFCSMIVMPWADTAHIMDKKDQEAEVFVDGVSKLKIEVKDTPTEFEVYRNINGGGCIIVPKGTPVLAIYAHAFGPASKAACEQYVAGHCGLAPA